MELEIGSPHKSLQSVDSLVWPRTVPRLRSLSTEQSQAKHIFIDCVCVCLLEREVNIVCMCLFGQAEHVHTRFSAYAQNKGAMYTIQCTVVVKCLTFCHFLITKWSEINGILLSCKSLPRHQTDLCVVMMSEES